MSVAGFSKSLDISGTVCYICIVKTRGCYIYRVTAVSFYEIVDRGLCAVLLKRLIISVFDQLHLLLTADSNQCISVDFIGTHTGESVWEQHAIKPILLVSTCDTVTLIDARHITVVKDVKKDGCLLI